VSGKLQDKSAWISGASSGIGRAIAERFAAEGAAVAIVDVDQRAGVALRDELLSAGQRAIFIACDVADEQQIKSSIDHTIAAFARLDILVNNAGIVHVKRLEDYTEAEWDQLMGVNVKSIFLSMKHAYPHLRRQPRSYIVNIGSISSFVAQGSTPAYTASKGAVLQLSRSIALDYAADGIRSNCICPGITDTPLLRHHLKATGDEQGTLRQRLRRVPMGVALAPHDIARAALYFACEDSAGITGTSLVVDCGYLAAAEWESPSTKFQQPLGP
jgi:NAD(P)-dependent dehydrogenase (short-subunit alcohol dehydrogenase family)